MAIKFTTTAKAGALHGIKVCVYARAGMGKTTLCATAPRPFIISAEAGLLSLRKFAIPVAEIATYADLWEVYEFCTKSKEAAKYDTFCLDSVTEIAERVLAAAKASSRDPRQAYGALADDTYALIRAFRDISGKHVYFSAKQQTYIADNGGMPMFGPAMPGKQLGPGMPYLFDLVANINVANTNDGKPYRYLRTQPDAQYDAKDRSGALDPIERPDLSYIFQKILTS